MFYFLKIYSSCELRAKNFINTQILKYSHECTNLYSCIRGYFNREYTWQMNIYGC